MSDPIWTGQDAEIRELQEFLSPYAYEGEAPELPERASVEEPRPRLGPPLALAAGLLLALGGAWMLRSQPASWAVTQLEGASVCLDEDSCRLVEGQWLVTDQDSRALLEVADIGSMEVAPGSRLRLSATGSEEHRLELAQGRIDAAVIAPPRLLVVETPAATAVDLGCAYTLEVDEDGDGELLVSSGWVSLETETMTTLVVAGAEANMYLEHGPGLPTWWDAEPAFGAAVEAFEQGRVSDPAQMLEHARKRDTYTLWHALQRMDRGDRLATLDTISRLSPEAELDHQRLLELDEEALEQAWSELHPDWG